MKTPVEMYIEAFKEAIDPQAHYMHKYAGWVQTGQQCIDECPEWCLSIDEDHPWHKVLKQDLKCLIQVQEDEEGNWVEM